jgi:hypothetical protein
MILSIHLMAPETLVTFCILNLQCTAVNVDCFMLYKNLLLSPSNQIIYGETEKLKREKHFVHKPTNHL